MNTLMALVLSYLAPSVIPPSSDPQAIPITGIVVERSGEPVRGADVWLVNALRPDDDRCFGVELVWSSRSKPGEGTIPVAVHGQTDSWGKFTLSVPPEVVARRVPPVLAIWSATSGLDGRVASRVLPRVVLAHDPPIRLELGRAMRTQVTVIDPAGRPIARAKVTPNRGSDVPLPEALGRAIAGTTDAHGRAFVTGPMPDEVQVQAPGFGHQTITIPRTETPDSRVQGDTDRSLTVKLAPVGRVVGRLLAPGNEPVMRVTVKATTQVGGYTGPGQGGSAEVSCDAQGRFEIPEIAAGALTLLLVFDRENGTRLRGEAPPRLVVSAGRATEVTIPLRPTIKVSGQYRERESKRPIAGVKILLNGQFGGDRYAITGADGAWSGWIRRDTNQPFAWPLRIPSPYYRPGDMDLAIQRMPPACSNELVLPPVELPRGVDLKGLVVNERGEPVAGAQVEAGWEFAMGPVHSLVARTDQSGQFVLHGVDPIAELKLSAWDGFAGTAAEVTIRAEAAQTKPVVLTIAPVNTVPVSGRVVDAAGNPIAGASIQLWHRVRGRNGREQISEPLVFGDPFRSIRTDSQGRYRSPRRLPLGGECWARAVAPGRLTAYSGTVKLNGASHELQAIVLRQVRTIEGHVVDRHEKPVAGAVVRQSGDGPMPTRAMSAPDGHFQLDGVLEGPAILCAGKEGFRFQLQTVDDAPRPIKVVLTKLSETPTRVYQTLASARPVEEERALARQLMQPLADKVLSKGSDRDKFGFLRDAIDVDPSVVLEWLGAVKLNDPNYLGLIRLALVRVLARDNLDEATALIEAGSDAKLRASGYAELCEVRRHLDPVRDKAWLAQATLNVRAPTAPAYLRIVVADRWMDFGEVDQARKLLREAEGLIKETTKNAPRPPYALGQIAPVLARIDLPAALAILDDLDRQARKSDRRDATQILDRHIGAVAYSLAAQSPADAERVLGRLSLRVLTVRTIAAVCFKMAPKDLARARRIADSRISPDAPAYRPYTLGLMAQAIAARDKAGAARLIEDAYRGLDDLVAAGGQPLLAFDPLTVAAGLLSIVEQVEPERLADYLGRTLALRPATGDRSDPGEVGAGWNVAKLVMMVARYDRQLAARLLEPELREIGSHTIRRGIADSAIVVGLSALALIDPRQAVERVLALPADPGSGTDRMTTKNRARIEVAKLLSHHGVDRWQFFYQRFANLWTPGQDPW